MPSSKPSPTRRRDVVFAAMVGRAFYDGQHATTEPSPTRRRDVVFAGNHPPNLRMTNKKPTNVTIWEIHPVMDLQIIK